MKAGLFLTFSNISEKELIKKKIIGLVIGNENNCSCNEQLFLLPFNQQHKQHWVETLLRSLSKYIHIISVPKDVYPELLYLIASW